MGDLSDQAKAVAAKFGEKGAQIHANVAQAVTNAALRIERGVKLSMKNTETVEPGSLTRGGRLMGHPTTSSKGKASWHLPSAPGFAPAIDKGRLVASYTHEIDDDGRKAVVGTKSETGPWLEFGTSRMQARPALGPAVDREREKFGQEMGFSMTAPKIEAEDA